jgi:predicted metalloprotease
VQDELGIMKQFDEQSRRMDDASRNALSVKLELQADCFAGVWGHYVQSWNKLEPGDIESGLRAAAAVGDDTIQKRTQGYVVPESFTHGSAEQRTRWFRTGFDSGNIRACNTFASR